MDLVAEVGKRRSILRCRNANSVTKAAKQVAWREVIAAVNASHSSFKERTKVKVKKQWQNLLDRAKKEKQLLLDGHATGLYGPDVALSLLSQRVLEVVTEDMTDEVSLDQDASPETLESLVYHKEEESEPEVILGTFDVDHRTTQQCHVDGNGFQQSGLPPTANDRVPLPTPSAVRKKFRDRESDAGTCNFGSFVACENRVDSTNESLQRRFFESALRTSEEVSGVSREFVRMRKREHALKMALLRSKNKYYELKLRKLELGDTS